jgi:hypothetical protein
MNRVGPNAMVMVAVGQKERDAIVTLIAQVGPAINYQPSR